MIMIRALFLLTFIAFGLCGQGKPYPVPSMTLAEKIEYKILPLYQREVQWNSKTWALSLSLPTIACYAYSKLRGVPFNCSRSFIISTLTGMVIRTLDELTGPIAIDFLLGDSARSLAEEWFRTDPENKQELLKLNYLSFIEKMYSWDSGFRNNCFRSAKNMNALAMRLKMLRIKDNAQKLVIEHNQKLNS